MEQHVLRQDSLIAIARLSRNVAASSSSRVAARASSPWDFTHRCYLEPGVPCAARVAHRRSLTTTTLLRQCLLLDVVPNQGSATSRHSGGVRSSHSQQHCVRVKHKLLQEASSSGCKPLPHDEGTRDEDKSKDDKSKRRSYRQMDSFSS
ncbi:uncharacterized protein LOC100381707 [Zea mays]|uniref:Uncharacterized protein n=1 Tax=Zea mays TaxID=4577 RepID=C0HI84_MAIZE|nr:uncharacterized protein LOC100381707 [Zea mays]ACN26737.1 unknown [Zea mays]|eukprot:NP_001167987.1 uncharacterized protein LOC100381707 [Zea mays]